MMDHIVDHSEQVCRVAVCLADKLSSEGIELNLELIGASALLHDITKTRSFRTHENHAQTGGKFLQEFPGVTGICVQINGYDFQAFIFVSLMHFIQKWK